MFETVKKKTSEKIRLLKKAAFLALAGYLYDKVTKRKSKEKEYVEGVEYKVKNKK